MFIELSEPFYNENLKSVLFISASIFFFFCCFITSPIFSQMPEGRAVYRELEMHCFETSACLNQIPLLCMVSYMGKKIVDSNIWKYPESDLTFSLGAENKRRE